MEKLIRDFLLSDDGTGFGPGFGFGFGFGFGDGSGSGYGYGYGDGDDSGYGDGDGFGDGYGDGSGYGDVYASGDGSGNGDNDGEDINMFNGERVYMIDGIPTIIKKIRNDIARGYIMNVDFTLTETYVVKGNNKFAHGETLHDAFSALNKKPGAY